MNASGFSTIGFLMRRDQAVPVGGSPVSSGWNDRSALVEKIREQLLNAASLDTEQAVRSMEVLSRAVVGHAPERKQLKLKIRELLVREGAFDDSDPEGQFPSLTEAVFAEVIGLNVLELIMDDRTHLEEIQVVGTEIYEIRAGMEKKSPYRFRSLRELERIQQNLVLYNRDAFHYGKRWAEVQLCDGSRVTMTGFGFTAEPTLTIRFYHDRRPDLNGFVESRSMDDRTAVLLRELVRDRWNLVLIGPTNSGKTMLMKALIGEMPDEERLVTIETRRELMLRRDFPRKNVVEYEVDEDDSRHSGAQAFKLALRQSPKRIVHAEVRDSDANLYVRACTRGHPGSMTTLHASALEDVPAALTDMCLMDGSASDPDALARRIATYVTQVGIELGIVDGIRRVVRVGRYRVIRGEICVEDLVRYDAMSKSYVHAPGRVAAYRKEAG